MADLRTRHLTRLRWLRRSARWWTVTAGGLVGATVVLLPYEGIGLPDAFWAAGAGGSVAIAFWRWADLRALATQPIPEPLSESARAARNQQRLERIVGRLPIGRTAIGELHRVQHLSKIRGRPSQMPGRASTGRRSRWRVSVRESARTCSMRR